MLCLSTCFVSPPSPPLPSLSSPPTLPQAQDNSSAHHLGSSTLSLNEIQPIIAPAPQDPAGGPVLLQATTHPDKPPPIAEYTPEEEASDHRRYRTVCVGGEKVRVDLNLIQEYRGIVQHGGKIERRERGEGEGGEGRGGEEGRGEEGEGTEGMGTEGRGRGRVMCSDEYLLSLTSSTYRVFWSPCRHLHLCLLPPSSQHTKLPRSPAPAVLVMIP